MRTNVSRAPLGGIAGERKKRCLLNRKKKRMDGEEKRKRRGVRKEQHAVLKKAASCWVARSPIQRFHEILWSVPVACRALIGQR